MEPPKCKICDERHWGQCGGVADRRETREAKSVKVPVNLLGTDPPKRSRAQAASALEPTGRTAFKLAVRLNDHELIHLDEIRGSFSRNDAVRLLLRAAERLGI